MGRRRVPFRQRAAAVDYRGGVVSSSYRMIEEAFSPKVLEMIVEFVKGI